MTKKPRERQQTYRERLRKDGWSPVTLILPTLMVEDLRAKAKASKTTLGSALVLQMLSLQEQVKRE